MSDCLFCGIAAKEIPSFVIYEDERHIAVLDIFPAVRGQSLVLPKQHHGSYVFNMPDDEYSALMLASKRVSHILDERLPAIRTCMVMEGMEIDHAHIKLYPLHNIVAATSADVIDLNNYRGFISTQHGERADNAELEKILSRLHGNY